MLIKLKCGALTYNYRVYHTKNLPSLNLVVYGDTNKGKENLKLEFSA